MRSCLTRPLSFLLALALTCALLPVAVLAQESLSGAVVTLSQTEYTYNGSPCTPAVTVTLEGRTLTQDQDYTLSYRDNTNAGSAAAVVTGTGSYEGSKEAAFTIQPKALEAEDFSAVPCSKPYDGSTAAAPALSASVLDGDSVSVSCESAEYDSPWAGSGKTVTAKGLSLSGQAGGNYSVDPALTVTFPDGQIVPSLLQVPQSLSVATGGSTLDIRSHLSGIGSKQMLTFAFESAALGCTLDEGSGRLTSGTEAGTVEILIAAEEYNEDESGLPEYSASQETIQINLVAAPAGDQNSQPAQDSQDTSQPSQDSSTEPSSQEGQGETPAQEPQTDPAPEGSQGEAQPPIKIEGDSSVSCEHTLLLKVTGGAGSGSIYYLVEPITGIATIDANGLLTPVKPGTVWVSATKLGDDRYQDSDTVSKIITIRQAVVTVTPPSITAYVGDPIPDLSKAEYTVSGLAPGDKLSKEPVLRYASTPDMSVPGTTFIFASDAAIPEDEYYDPQIAYPYGSLTVLSRSAYAISVAEPQNGSIAVDQSTAPAGMTVTITAKAADGYALKDLTVQTGDGTNLTLTTQDAETFRFTMPEEAVFIIGSFQPASGSAPETPQEETPQETPKPQEETPREETPATIPFNDVLSTDWFYNDVLYVFQHELMNGTGENRFNPALTTTRGMIVTILYRMEGKPSVDRPSSFEDVPADMYYAAPIAWAASLDIVNGYSPTAFGPEDPITREQMAAILYRYARYKGLDVSQQADLSAYVDQASIQDYARPAMAWANAAGLIRGKDGSQLDPGGPATRAEVSAILHRYALSFQG